MAAPSWIGRRRIRAFSADQRGLAAVEFALVLPLLIVLYFGFFELTRAINLSRKSTLFARSVADLVGQLPRQYSGQPASSSESDVNAIFDGASAILAPFVVNDIQIVVSAIGIQNASGTRFGRVCSSFARGTAPRKENLKTGQDGLPDIPPAYDFDDARYVLAEITVPYSPVIGEALYRGIFGTPGLVFKRQIPWAERNGEIALPPTSKLCK